MNFVIWNKGGDKPERSAKITPAPETELQRIEPINITTATTYRESNNKRQDSSDKLSERYLIEQRGLNPYISHSSYANDIETQQSFLIPKCSNEHPS